MRGRQVGRGTGMAGRRGVAGAGALLAAVVLLWLAGRLGVQAAPRVAAAAPVLHLVQPMNGPNDTETIGGSGFTPGDQVTIVISNSVYPGGQRLAVLPVDATGRIGGQITLPLGLDAGPLHPNTLTAVAAGDASARATATLIGVAVQPVLTVSLAGPVSPGSTIGAIYGAGFGSGGPSAQHRPDVLTLYLGDVALTTTTTGPSGNISVFNVAVPAAVPAGNVLLTARGIVGGIGQRDVATAPVAVTGPASLTVTPSVGHPGGSLTVDGAGFAPGEQVGVVGAYPDPNVAGGTATVRAATTAGDDGHAGPISVTVAATAVRTGQVALIARGASSGRAAGAIASLAGTAALFIDPSSGPPTTVVTATGFGFASGQQVTVVGPATTTTGLADAAGAVTTSFSIPAATRPGTYTVQARDPSGDQAAAPFVVAAAPAVSLVVTPTVSVPQGRVVVTGTGFTAAEAVTLTVDGAPLSTQPVSIVADGQGSFTATATLPPRQREGQAVVRARGVQSLLSGQTVVRVILPLDDGWPLVQDPLDAGPAVNLTATLHLLAVPASPAAVSLIAPTPRGTLRLLPIGGPGPVLELPAPAGVLAGPVGGATGPSSLDAEGVARLRRGNAPGALADFSAALRLSPTDAAAYAGRARARLELGNPGGALADFAAALGLTPGDGGLSGERGLVRLRLGDLSDAVADLDRAVRLAPSATAYLNRGAVRYSRGNLPGALADFAAAARLAPQFAVGYDNRGTARLALGNRGGALADFAAALALWPDDANAAYNRGIVHALAGDARTALADDTLALRLDPSNALAAYNRGAVRYGLGDLAGALSDFSAVLRRQPHNADAAYNRGVVRAVVGNLFGALADVSQALQQRPAAALYTARGSLRLALGNRYGALADFTAALRLDPGAGDADAGRGVVEALLGNTAAALADDTAALRLQPRAAAVYYQRSLARAAVGNPYGALADVGAALRLAPNNVLYLLARGRLRLNLGNPYGALADDTQALLLAPHAVAAAIDRADVRARLNDLAGALADSTRALQEQPTNATAHYNHGYVLVLLGQVPQARADFVLARTLYGAQGDAADYRRTLDVLRRLGP